MEIHISSKTLVQGKYFPGPPCCQFCGKDIPALVLWNKSELITSGILVEALRTLDVLNVIPRNDNIKPFPLLDGHGSRLEIPFLQYINYPDYHWVVCLGVPYGTAIWQVCHLKEQNSSFNIAFTKVKQNLLNYGITITIMTIGEKVYDHNKITLPPSMQPVNINSCDSNHINFGNSRALAITISHSSHKTCGQQSSFRCLC